jgi:ubiquinone/menaquinone biosynthesis C-methylase UbiE
MSRTGAMRANGGTMSQGSMSQLTPHHERVGQEYALNNEELRLENEDPIEYEITARYLHRYVPKGVVVADIGVGGGQYSALLVRQGCRVHLVDVSQHLLDIVATRFRTQGLSDHIASIQHASATDLSHLSDESCDIVLLLGPLYHLMTAQDRQRAVREAARILRSRGLVFAAGINLLTYLRDVIRDDPEDFARRRAFFVDQLFRDGNLTPPGEHPAMMHVTTTAKLRADLAGAFEEVALIGVESFASKREGARAYLGASPEARDALLDLVERTGTTPEGLGVTSHYLYIGRKVTSGDA